MAAALHKRVFAGSGSRPAAFGLTIAVVLHGTAALALFSYTPAAVVPSSATPIMVSLIAAPAPRAVVPDEVPGPRPVATVPQQAKPADLQSELATSGAETRSTAPAPPTPLPAETAAPQSAQIAIAPPDFSADYLENPAPSYPAYSRRVGEQGRVLLRVLVNSEGRADDVQIRASSGFARLDDAARDAVRRWRFIPAKRGIEPIAAWALVPISFRLKG